MKTVYTNIIGAFVFEKGKLLDERLFSKQEIRENFGNLGKGELKQEKDLLEKHGARMWEGNPDFRMLEAFGEKKYLEKLREANLIVTRKMISQSVKIDHHVIQAVNSVEEIDKIANMMAKRLREWYELHNPEFSHALEDHEKFVQLIISKPRKELLKEVGSSEEETMGAEVRDEDLKAMRDLAKGTDELYALRKRELDYITLIMKENYPNIELLAGAAIGAKLLSIAGSLQKMAMMPASTIQLLGAEKALFRHMTTGAKPPKFGVIINHPLVTRAKKSDKGRVARALADKISLAAKIDFFKGEFRGEEMKKDLEERFK